MKKMILIISFVCMLFGSQQAKAQKYYAANWWNTPPETWQFFAGADVAFPSDEGLGNPAFGIHAGMIKDFGFYGRILLNGTRKDNAHTAYDHPMDIGYHYMLKDGKANQVFQSATVGGMLRLWCPIYLNVGVGVANNEISYELRNGGFVIADPDSEEYAFGGEAGLSLRINNFMVGGGHMRFGSAGAVFFNLSYCF